MSIAAMKHLRLIGLRRDQEALFRRLQRLGCVEVDEPQGDPEDPAWACLKRQETAALAAAKARRDLGEQALDLLKRSGGTKSGGLKPRPEVDAGRFFDSGAYQETGALVDELCGAQRALAALEAERTKLTAQREALEPWLALDVPLETGSTAQVTALFGSLPGETDLDALSEDLGELCALTPAGADAGKRYLFFLCHKSAEEEAMEKLRQSGFDRISFRELTGTAAENHRRLDKELKENEEQRRLLQERIAQQGGRTAEVKSYVDRSGQEVAMEEARGRLLDTDETFYLTGWVPADEVEKLEQVLGEFVCAWDTREPTEEEYPQVPVKLKNGWFARPLNMVTEMYSLPAYGSVDPNPLMAPFFILFYGMMMADMGYGLVMMAISAWAMKKLKPKGPTMRYMTPLIGLCGVSTFIWGALTGGFFGDLLPQMAMLVNPNTTFTAMPALFSPLDDAVPVLIGSLVLGLIQIFVGMAVSMRQKLRRGAVAEALCNEGAWYVVFLLAGVAALGVIPVKAAIIAIVVLLVLTQGYGKKGVIGKLMGIFGSLYNNITGYFSDILSYSRLMALMLAGAVVAQVFNQLGAMTGNVIAFFIIAMIGNALNFALNILGCYVHDMRLQCLEFFGRFYEDGGKPFRPLDIDTQYVDITNH